MTGSREDGWIAPASGCRHCRDTGVILSWNLGGDEVGRACPDCERGAEVFCLGRPAAPAREPDPAAPLPSSAPVPASPPVDAPEDER